MPPKRNLKVDSDAEDSIDTSAGGSNSTSRPTPTTPSKSSSSSKPGSPSKKTRTPTKVQPWSPEEERRCFLRILATADIKLTKEIAADLQALTSRSYDSVHNWWFKRITPEIRKAKEMTEDE